mgnify:CR=1 FL=1
MKKLSAIDVLLKSSWAILTLGSVFLFFITASYLNFCSECNFLLKKQDVVYNPFWRTAFYFHITGGMLAIITGPLQFVKAFRKRFMKVHRVIGKIYIAAILFLAGPTGLFMAFYAEGGTFSIIGFLFMSTLWLTTTYLAYESIRKKDFVAHRDWMVRSFALSLAAVTLRTCVPILTYYLGFDAETVITWSAWFSWVPNLIIAELLIRFFSKKL